MDGMGTGSIFGKITTLRIMAFCNEMVRLGDLRIMPQVNTLVLYPNRHPKGKIYIQMEQKNLAETTKSDGFSTIKEV